MSTKLFSIEELLKATPEQLDEAAVDCGTCPVSMRCVMQEQGIGDRFTCCGSIGVEANIGDGREFRLMVLDCAKNQFKGDNSAYRRKGKCPLCNGDIVDACRRGMVGHYIYARTAHAKVSSRSRVNILNRAKKTFGWTERSDVEVEK